VSGVYDKERIYGHYKEFKGGMLECFRAYIICAGKDGRFGTALGYQDSLDNMLLHSLASSSPRLCQSIKITTHRPSPLLNGQPEAWFLNYLDPAR
jgi:hypothetical protein